MEVKILSGNELVIQGGLEAGFSLYTGYPGSPLADFFNILYQQREDLFDRGIRVVLGNSEANAAAMASGAKQVGRDVCLAMKSMGLHVASDALSVGNFADSGPKHKNPKTNRDEGPGVVVVVGDDPWSLSTSIPADSRYLFKHLHIPFLEPSTPQELKDWMKVALEISRKSSLYQGLLLTTFMAEGGGRVECYDRVEVSSEKENLNPSEFDLSKNVMVPPNSLKADRSMILERFPLAKEVLRELSLDRVFGDQASSMGIISSGATFETLKQILEEGEYLSFCSLYKVAGSYPLVDELLVPYLKGLETLVVVEEKRGFLEGELLALCQRHNLRINIYGKKFEGEELFMAHGGLSYESIKERLKILFKKLEFKISLPPKTFFLKWEESFPLRLPTFCPGCPHRETLSLLKNLRIQLENSGVSLISHGDVGCYSLSFLPPFKEMHNLSAMGQGGALGLGLDLFSKNPSVVLMGDSTFFHSGMVNISNSVQAGHNITYIILDNDNTAMTGHQMTPISGLSVEGYKRPRQEIMPIVVDLGVDEALEVNPSDRYFYKNILKEMIDKNGVKVIISNKECALTFMSRKKKRERELFQKGKTLREKEFYQINTDVCDGCRECVEMTGCPGLSQMFDAYGSKMTIDPQICVSDSYCTKLKVCPSFELVKVAHYHPSKYLKRTELGPFKNAPLPDRVISWEKVALGKDFRIVVTGVGGSGVTTISRVLAEAAKTMGGRKDIDFKFVDQKGLAQRNGRVTGHLSFFKKGKSQTAVTPLGQGDLLLSSDLLDGPAAISFLSEKGLAIFDEDFQVPLSILLDREKEGPSLTVEKMRYLVKEKFGEKLFIGPFKKVSEQNLGRDIYVSSMILGVAFQSGRLPFSEEDLIEAISRVISKEEVSYNLDAFNLGRKIFLEGTSDLLKEEKIDKNSFLKKSIEESFLPWQNKDYFLELFQRNSKRLFKIFPHVEKDYLRQYLHDQIIYDRGVNLDVFFQEVTLIKANFENLEQQKSALATLASCFFIKDEIFISHQMVSPLQRFKDKKMYQKMGRSFKKSYINRPNILGFEFDISPKVWMLKMMRHLRLFRPLISLSHKQEKKIALMIRKELTEKMRKLDEKARYVRLKEIENIKGYRDIRIKKGEVVFQ